MLYLLLAVHLQNYLVQLCLNLFADFYQLIGMKKNLISKLLYPPSRESRLHGGS